MTGQREVQVGGAILASILAAVAIVLAVRVDALLVPDPRDSPIAIVFGPGGITQGDPIGGAGRTVGPPSSRTLPIWPLIVLAILTVAGWAIAMTILGTASRAGFD
jgi:hypothetical protein